MKGQVVKELKQKAKKAELNLIDIPIRHLGTEKAHELYKRIDDLSGLISNNSSSNTPDLEKPTNPPDIT